MADREPTPGWALYLRVSNEDKQSPERSFAMQRMRIEEQLLRGSGLPVYREYCDLLTGTTPRRADYQQLLADAEAGRFSHLALYRADRFGRNAVEGLEAATRLISYGVRIRVAHMPSLQPETPDGFFMFTIQMGMAQREVEVMRQRIGDGMLAKLIAGGWAMKAPEGYLNKEQLISSGKYFRWVELDESRRHVLREAWDLLLTDRFALAQICEELTRRGYTKSSGRPWAWRDPATGARKNNGPVLSKIFHNPFYAGWVISPSFGIAMGQVRGSWEPIITTDEYYRGLEILKKHHTQRSKRGKYPYLLRDLLWIESKGHAYKLYCSTPRGKSKHYSYYVAAIKAEKRSVHLRCELIDGQIPGWLSRIRIRPEFVPDIRAAYVQMLQKAKGNHNDAKVSDLRRRIAGLRDEEAHLARMLVTGKVGEEAYERLRAEWQEKLSHAQRTLEELERDLSQHLDDLDAALTLLTCADQIYPRLEHNERITLLKILVRRFFLDENGKIIRHELHTPFVYLGRLRRSVRFGRHKREKAPAETVNRELPTEELGQFLAQLHFEQRNWMVDMPAEVRQELQQRRQTVFKGHE